MRHSRHIGLALSIIGLMVVGRGVYEVAGGRIYQSVRGRQLDRVLESLPAQPTTHLVSYQPGSAVGRLEIPRLGLSVVVLEGSDTETLRLGVGRLHNSGLPGEPGNVVLAGHRDTFFRSLHDIKPGDRISLRTTQGTFPYTVDYTQVVNPTDTEVLKATSDQSLTLVTCYPFSYIGSAPQRFIVRAIPQGAVSSHKMSPFALPETPAPPPPAVAPTRALTVAQVDEPGAPSAAAAPSEREEVPADKPEPRKQGFFHKLAGVFGSHRAKLQ